MDRKTEKVINKIKISAVVVSFNEAHLLDECISSLCFCDEIVLIDLGSIDDTIFIAKKYNALIYERPRAPFVEINQHWVVDKVKNDWILYIDPDEIVDEELATEIINTIPKLSDEICQIELPWQFYFKNHPLKGTTWGGANSKGVLIHRNRIIVNPISQDKFSHISGYKPFVITRKKNNVIHHYWMQNFRTLLEKHNRYLEVEKKDRFNKGERFSWGKLFITPLSSFYYSFITKKGYKDGMIGIFLSLFWSWYCMKSIWVLRVFQKRV